MFNLTTLNHFLLVAWPCLLYMYFNLPHNRITHITFYTQSKRLTSYYTLFPLHYKQLRPWEVCSPDDSWTFAASHSLMHFINWCT